MSNDLSVTFRNRFLCKSCKKLLFTKESLDNHIIICYESRLEKQREEHKSEIDKLKKDYEEKIDEIMTYMASHINSIEQKHINLSNYLLDQIKKLSYL